MQARLPSSLGQHRWATALPSEHHSSPVTGQSCHLSEVSAPQFLAASIPRLCPTTHQVRTYELPLGPCCHPGETSTTEWTCWAGNGPLDWERELRSISGSVRVGTSHLASLGLNFPLCKIKREGSGSPKYSSSPDGMKRDNIENRLAGLSQNKGTHKGWVCVFTGSRSSSQNAKRRFRRASWGK